MKYWRGYLVAAIIAACTWGLREFAAAHTVLVDMIYPYVSRMIQGHLVQWSSGVDFCIWQTVLLVLIALALATIVLMVVLKWNPIQLFGWFVAAASIGMFLHTAIYGLNIYSGPLAEDVRLHNSEYAYTVTELEQAAKYYREFANSMSNQIGRDGTGQLRNPGFHALSEQAGEGFRNLTYKNHYPIFAGSTVPVKEMTFSTNPTTTGMTVPLTGESSVNPNIPTVALPFAICHEMAHRMCIAVDSDANFAAYMACDANSSIQFRYSAYFMAYRACLQTLAAVDASTGSTYAQKLAAGETAKLKADIAAFDAYFGDQLPVDSGFCDLLVTWHVEKIVLPAQQVEEELFDPMDESQVDLSGLANAGGGNG